MPSQVLSHSLTSSHTLARSCQLLHDPACPRTCSHILEHSHTASHALDILTHPGTPSHTIEHACTSSHALAHSRMDSYVLYAQPLSHILVHTHTPSQRVAHPHTSLHALSHPRMPLKALALTHVSCTATYLLTHTHIP